MKKLISLFILSLMTLNPFFLNIAFADTMKYGQLNIVSEISGGKIYVDGTLSGENVVNLNQVTVGSHYVKVIDAQLNVVFSKLVTVKEGETTTLVVKQKAAETEVLEQEITTQGVKPIELKGADYKLGFESGKSDGYQKGYKEGVHQARINKAWTGWAVWVVFLLLIISSSSR